MEHMRK